MKFPKKVIIQLILIIVLAFLFFFTTGIISEKSSFYLYWNLMRSALLLIAAWLSTKFITLIFLNPISEALKKTLPNIIKHLLSTIIYFIALSIIMTEVYGKTMTNIGALFISSWAIIGLAAKDIITECIYGIYSDFQTKFEIGDWVQLKDGTTGKILKIKITGLEILLSNNSILFISNTSLNNEPIINLSKPGYDYYASINLSLDSKIPVSQAIKILSKAMESSPVDDFKIFADAIRKNKIAYVIHFKIQNQENLSEIKHQVLTNVVEQIQNINSLV